MVDGEVSNGSKEFTLPSGTVLLVSVAPYEDSRALTNAILAELQGLALTDKSLQEELSKLKTLADLQNAPHLLTMAIDKALGVVISPKVEAAMFRCLGRAKYGDVRFTKDLLDDKDIGIQVREDLMRAFLAVAEVNCLPFFKRLFSGSKGPLGAAKEPAGSRA